MKLIKNGLVALCFALPLISIGGSALAQTGDPGRTAERLGGRIEAGREVAADSDIDWGRAVAVLDTPYDRVVQAVREYADYRHFLPFFTASRVVSSRGSSAIVYMEASVLHGTTTLWANMRMRVRDQNGEGTVVEGRMADGNMADFRARWEVQPIDDGRRSLLTLRVLIDPDLPLPNSICSNENASTARRTIRALRRRLVTTPSA